MQSLYSQASPLIMDGKFEIRPLAFIIIYMGWVWSGQKVQKLGETNFLKKMRINLFNNDKEN